MYGSVYKMPVNELKTKGRKVYVGMSGGVDSSVSAAILKEQGYDVTGVFIKVWQPDSTDCGWKDERRDAMRVAAVLDIPFKTFDFSEKYKKEVVDYMISEYKAGRTPNPDVMCNRYVKFGSFLEQAINDGVDYVATGHYAQNIYNKELGFYEMHEGADSNKDQSYFLWTLTQSDLKHTLFPVGAFQKDEVRKLAEKYKLPVFDKKDSQGVCFIGHLDMKEFLKEHIDVKKGDVLDTDGNVLGEHDGVELYTEGERHGFKVFVKTTDNEPYYIVKKDLKNNTLTVQAESDYKCVGECGPAGSHGDGVHEINISKLSFTSEEYIKEIEQNDSNTDKYKGEDKINSQKIDLNLKLRLRYRQSKISGTLSEINLDKKTAKLKLNEVQKAIPYGQSAVFYLDNKCIGGGVIEMI
jgi:tRNA-uridine 2-sulfurtransferase